MATEAEIHSWISDVVRDFDTKCQALMWQMANHFGTVASTPESAIAAWEVEKAAGRTHGGTPPPGAFVYWKIGVFGHVGFVLNDGRIFMATRNIDEQWSDRNTGPQGLSDYSAITRATYLGWSMQNGGNTVPFTPDLIPFAPDLKGGPEMGKPMIYSAVPPPGGITAKMLEQNSGLKDGRVTFLMLGTSPGAGFANAELTQDQELITEICAQVMGPVDLPTSFIVGASWEWLSRMWAEGIVKFPAGDAADTTALLKALDRIEAAVRAQSPPV